MGRLKKVNRKLSKEKLMKLTDLKKEKMNMNGFSIIKTSEFKGPRLFVANPITPTPLLFTPTKMNYSYYLENDLKTPASKILESNIKSVKSKEYQTPDNNMKINNQDQESGNKNLMDSNIKQLLSKPILNSLEKILFSNDKKIKQKNTTPESKVQVPIFKPNSPVNKNQNPLNFQSVPYLPIRKSNCNCKNSKCLKLYCDCFRNQRFCQELCNCNGCGNKLKNDDRKKAIDIVVKKNPKAFDVKFETNKITVKKKDLEDNVSYRVNFVYTKGCNCKNSQCQKRYCDCFQFGLSCNSKCKCEGCLNGNQNKDLRNDDNSNGLSSNGNGVIIQQSIIDIKTELKEKLIKIKTNKFSTKKPICLKYLDN